MILENGLGKGGLSRINSKLRGSTSTLLVLVVNIYVISILCSLTSVYMFSESYELSPNFAHYTSLSIIDVIRIVIDIIAFPIFCLLKLFTISQAANARKWPISAFIYRNFLVLFSEIYILEKPFSRRSPKI